MEAGGPSVITDDVWNLNDEPVEVSFSCRLEESYVLVYDIYYLYGGEELHPSIKMNRRGKKLLS